MFSMWLLLLFWLLSFLLSHVFIGISHKIRQGWLETKHGITGFWTEAVQPGNDRFPCHSFHTTPLHVGGAGHVMLSVPVPLKYFGNPPHAVSYHSWWSVFYVDSRADYIIAKPLSSEIPEWLCEVEFPPFLLSPDFYLGEKPSDCVNPKTPEFLCYNSNVSLYLEKFLSEVVWCHKSKWNCIALAQELDNG